MPKCSAWFGDYVVNCTGLAAMLRELHTLPGYCFIAVRNAVERGTYIPQQINGPLRSGPHPSGMGFRSSCPLRGIDTNVEVGRICLLDHMRRKLCTSSTVESFSSIVFRSVAQPRTARLMMFLPFDTSGA